MIRPDDRAGPSATMPRQPRRQHGHRLASMAGRDGSIHHPAHEPHPTPRPPLRMVRHVAAGPAAVRGRIHRLDRLRGPAPGPAVVLPRSGRGPGDARPGRGGVAHRAAHRRTRVRLAGGQDGAGAAHGRWPGLQRHLPGRSPRGPGRAGVRGHARAGRPRQLRLRAGGPRLHHRFHARGEAGRGLRLVWVVPDVRAVRRAGHRRVRGRVLRRDRVRTRVRRRDVPARGGGGRADRAGGPSSDRERGSVRGCQQGRRGRRERRARAVVERGRTTSRSGRPAWPIGCSSPRSS